MANRAANAQFADQLTTTPATVSKHLANNFATLDLDPSVGTGRVRAELAYLNR